MNSELVHRGPDFQNYVEYDALATIDNNSCQTPVILGCIDASYLEYWNWQLSPFNDEFYILFDPLGNGILIYDSSLPSGELLKDIKKVLQNSKIG